MITGIKVNKSVKMEEKKFLDVQELTDYIHVSKSLIYHMVSKNKIPHIKIGSRTIFDRVQIDQWLMNHYMIVQDLPQVPKM
jgi:excisionase family DNA binding protein